MGRTYYLLNTIGIALVAFACACTDRSEEPSPTASRSDSGAPNEPSEHWRLVIERADGRVETVLSSEQPIVCGSQEGPSILFFCGTAVGEGDIPPFAWDFLPVNIEAGDSYTIEEPALFTPESTPTTPTPTVIGP